MKKLFFLYLTMIFYGSLAFSQTIPEGSSKISTALQHQLKSESSVPVLIQLQSQADVSEAASLHGKEVKAQHVFQKLQQTAATEQRRLQTYFDENRIAYQSLFIVNALRAELNYSQIMALAHYPEVRMIMADPAIRHAEPTEWSIHNHHHRSQVEWGIERINADDVWEMGFRGQDVTVGGQDTGYEWDHPALKKQYRGYNSDKDTADHNFHWHDAIHMISPLSADSLNPCGLDALAPCDDSGHGTHTMGTMIGLDSTNQIGVAPEAVWCACRNMERGWGSPFTYLECFQWFLAPTDLNNENPNPSLAPHVINNSWSCPQFEGCDSTNWELLNMAVNNLRAAGTVVVVSAGNSGNNCSSINTPAAMFEGSFTVGATAINDTIAGFSSRGPIAVDSSFRLKPNVSAPGVSVRSARPNGQYGNASGTSMAGPHVAGLVALIISANPDLAGEVDMIEEIIEQTAVPKTTDQICGNIEGTEVPNHTYGHGRVDALAAVEAALALIGVTAKDNRTHLDINVFPNPAIDRFWIALSAEITEVRLRIFDAQGRLTFKEDWTHNGDLLRAIDVHALPTGIYFYLIQTNTRQATGRIVIQ